MKRLGRWVDWRQALRALALTVLGAVSASATAHEVRPAYLQITQGPDHDYEVLWKQPVMFDRAVHLSPHLSSGWLEEAPAAVEVTNSYGIKRWSLAARDHGALNGQTVWIEGLDNTITDALLAVRLADGSTWRSTLTPAHPRLTLHLAASSAVGGLSFLLSGIEHILTGADHLLFVLGLLLLVKDRGMLLKTVSAFTVAHSITLAAATLGYARPSVPFLNAAIALSIAFLGAECARGSSAGTTLTLRYPWVVAFVFGLLHGFGFAGGLTAVGLSRQDIPFALFLFNVGVEIGQLAFVLGVLWLRQAFRVLAICWPWPVRMLPAYTIGTLGVLWTLQRLEVLFGVLV